MKEKVEDNRIKYIDVAKGIGIILVVWYHIGYCPGYYLNLFFMPLFFLLSGLFFNVKCDGKTFLEKRYRQLLAPLLLGAVIGLFIEAVVRQFSLMKQTIESGFYNFWLVGNVPLWFLLALFWMMITYIVENKVRNEYVKILIYVAVSIIGYVLSYLQLKNTLFVGQACLAFPFFIIGYKFKGFWLTRGWMRWQFAVISLAWLLFAFMIWTPKLNVHQLYVSRHYINTMITSLVMVTIVQFLAYSLHKTLVGRFLAWVGEASLFVLILHDLFVPFTLDAINYICADFRWLVFSITAFVAAVLLCILCVPIGRTLKKVLPMCFPA